MTEPRPPNPILRAWERTLRRRGADLAILNAADGVRHAFNDLDAGARAIAEKQRSALLPGTAVVFAEPNGARWLELFVALTRLGAVAVPLDPGEPPERQRQMAQELRAHRWISGRVETHPSPRRWRKPSPALLKTTSGSTGRARILPFSAEELIADGRQVMRTMRIGANDLNYALIPFGHSYGLGNLVLPLILEGVPIVGGSAPLPHAIASEIERWRPTVFPGVPAMWRALAFSDVNRRSLSSLRLGISAGARLDPEIARICRERHGLKLHNFYGSSETGGIAYDASGTATLAGGVGRAMKGVHIRPAANGRVIVSSAAVFTRGNRRRVGALGTWSPADRVSLGRGGAVTVLGRRGNLAKVAGRRIDLAGIERRLLSVPGVREAFVAVSEDAEPQLGAALVTDLAPEEVRSRLRGDTASWRIPKRLVVLAALPLTARGKVDTSALRRRLFSAPAPHAPVRA